MQPVRKTLQPKPRSKLRLVCGRLAFTMLRRWKWFRMRNQLARQRTVTQLPHVIVRHTTPLFRKLRDVDVQLQHNKAHNLSLAVERLDQVTIMPGETLSYWRLIGKPTRRKGYVDGMILFCGRMRIGVGGGLCQLSNLIYWMALHTPLQVVERHRHSYDVFPDSGRTQPFGSGATCSYNDLDLMLFNPTGNPFQLELTLTGDALAGAWRSTNPARYRYEVYERDHAIRQEHWGGYVRHNILYRKAFNADGDCCADEYVTENHALMMYAPLLEADASAQSCSQEECK